MKEKTRLDESISIRKPIEDIDYSKLLVKDNRIYVQNSQEQRKKEIDDVYSLYYKICSKLNLEYSECMLLMTMLNNTLNKINNKYPMEVRYDSDL